MNERLAQVIMPAIGSLWTHAEGGTYEVYDTTNALPGLSSKFVPTVSYRNADDPSLRFSTSITRWNERFIPKATVPAAKALDAMPEALKELFSKIVADAKANGVSVGEPILVARGSDLGEALADLLGGPKVQPQSEAEAAQFDPTYRDSERPCDCPVCVEEAAEQFETVQEYALSLSVKDGESLPDLIVIGGTVYRPVEPVEEVPNEVFWDSLSDQQKTVLAQLSAACVGPTAVHPLKKFVVVPDDFQLAARELEGMELVEITRVFDNLLARFTEAGMKLCLLVDAN